MKNHSIFDRPNDRKSTPKPFQNRSQDGPKSTSEGSRREKQQKCKNNKTFIQQNSLKSGVENDMKIKCDFEFDFCRISVDFGAILAPKINPKWKKNGIKKHSDFQTKL